MAQVTSEEFLRACVRFATRVAIASVLDPNRTPHGLTVSFFTSFSLDPPLILICLGHEVSVIDHFRAAQYFGVNVLTENQRPLSERFARKGYDRFDGLDWQPGQTGVPLVPGALAAMECRTHQRFTSGDHDILVGAMVAARVADGEPLIHFTGRYRGLSR